jgi:hypothetical protein
MCFVSLRVGGGSFFLLFFFFFFFFEAASTTWAGGVVGPRAVGLAQHPPGVKERFFYNHTWRDENKQPSI